MGGTVKSLRADLEEKAAKLKDLLYEKQECDSAKKALQEFMGGTVKSLRADLEEKAAKLKDL